MKIESSTLTDYKPIKHLNIDKPRSAIAGANEARKTRLKQAIVETLQGFP